MGFISVSGTGSAAPIAGSAASIPRAGMRRARRVAARAGAAALALALLPGAVPTGTLEIGFTGQRSARGLMRVCLTADPDDFPNCVDDANAVTRSVPAGAGALTIAGLVPGAYAVAVIHDENGNARLDTFAGIPREGFGFSRNPMIRFGPPRFSAAEFPMRSGAEKQQIRLRYLL